MVLEIPHIWWQILQISGDGRRHCSELHHFLFRTVKAFLQYLANIEVSWNWVPPNDQCLKVFSIINHPIWGTPIYGTPMVVFWFQLVRTRTWKEAKSCALLVVLKVWFRFQCFYSVLFWKFKIHDCQPGHIKGFSLSQLLRFRKAVIIMDEVDGMGLSLRSRSSAERSAKSKPHISTHVQFHILILYNN